MQTRQCRKVFCVRVKCDRRKQHKLVSDMHFTSCSNTVKINQSSILNYRYLIIQSTPGCMFFSVDNHKIPAVFLRQHMKNNQQTGLTLPVYVVFLYQDVEKLPIKLTFD